MYTFKNTHNFSSNGRRASDKKEDIYEIGFYFEKEYIYICVIQRISILKQNVRFTTNKKRSYSGDDDEMLQG